MAKFDLTGKVAVVTGASRGLGYEISYVLAEQGAKLAMLATNPVKLEETVAKMKEEFNQDIKGYICDVSNEQQVVEVIGEIVKDFGQIDILVNNAGILNYAPIDDYTMDMWHKAIEVDLTGPWFVSKEVVVQSMRKLGKGSIINISSIAGFLGSEAGCLSYSAAKGGVLGLTKCQAVDYAQYGIRVNSVGPGRSDMGGMTSKSKVASDPTVKKNCPLGRNAEWGEIGHAVLYFAADESSFTTGQHLFVDGGVSSKLY